MKKLYILLLLPAILLLSSNFAFAQRGKNPATYRGDKIRFSKSRSYTSFGVSINALNYFGDLAPKSGALSTDLSLTKPGFGLAVSRKFSNHLFIRGSFIYGRIQADDFSADPYDADARFRYVRNQHFINDIKELALVASFDLFANSGGYMNRPDFTPYVFAGLAVFHHNPKAMVPQTFWNDGTTLPNAGEWVALQPLGTEGQYVNESGVNPYKRLQLAVPFGLGIKYKVSPVIDLAFELGYRHLFFDYIDDVGGEYADLSLLEGNLARAMSFRGKEETAVVSGSPRDFEAINGATSPDSYNGYEVFAGYGAAGDQRGGTGNDTYIATSIRVSYIIGNNQRRPRYGR